MGRNLYILAATLGVLALVCGGLSLVHVAQGPGSPGDAALWRTTGIVLFLIAMVVGLGGTLSALFEQAERRHEQQREAERRARREGAR
ncbi:hypothetical protein ACFQBQ_13930 [Granulicella cerasi]|uniref:Uncharacterized protein n=1 Tax=Granulicella cerasi TaxID=741063 RepID=A0ABW1ZB23_9BACT|nr:hypothetical protein [Granulicella cerasi]